MFLNENVCDVSTSIFRFCACIVDHQISSVFQALIYDQLSNQTLFECKVAIFSTGYGISG